MTNDPSAPPPPSPSPPVPAKKLSVLPWFLGGCGFLLIVGIVVAVVLFRSISSLTLMNTKVVGPKTTQNSQPLSNADLRTKSAPAPVPAGWSTYVNKRDEHPKLRDDFIAFSISYPPEFKKKNAPDAYLDLQKLDPSDDKILQEVSVNPASYEKGAMPESEYDSSLDKMSGFLKQVFSNFRMAAKESVMVDDVSGRAVNFYGDIKKSPYNGRLVMLFPEGSPRGLLFIMLERDSENGMTRKILQTFRW
ncbi:MAG: hypothetical protein M3N48_15530 [Verrucomicrobiota bacterium]|nr:hypothetical protein [Verrucomicrobiota bacterium]